MRVFTVGVFQGSYSETLGVFPHNAAHDHQERQPVLNRLTWNPASILQDTPINRSMLVTSQIRKSKTHGIHGTGIFTYICHKNQPVM